MNTKIYVAGPMTGIPMLNHPAFFAVEQDIKVLYPDAEIFLPPRLVGHLANPTWAECMAICLPKVCKADIIAILPGWDRSRGASLEVFVGTQLGKTLWAWPNHGA